MPYKNFKELEEDNPSAIIDSYGQEYLERPEGGWIEESDPEYFCGIGWHGLTRVSFGDLWKECEYEKAYT